MKWQSIKTAPKDGTIFLGYWDYGDGSSYYCMQPMKYLESAGRFVISWDYDEVAEVSFWRPMPKRPKETRK